MQVALAEWSPDDLVVLERANTGAMTVFLGGPESAEELAARHAEYLAYAPGEGAMFRVEVDGHAIGYAGWWAEVHEGIPVREIGCSIEPHWQGRGIATAALERVIRAAASVDDRPVVGYAETGNTASNALCARLGMGLRGTGVFPSDDGDLEVNIWWRDVSAG